MFLPREGCGETQTTLHIESGISNLYNSIYRIVKIYTTMLKGRNLTLQVGPKANLTILLTFYIFRI